MLPDEWTLRWLVLAFHCYEACAAVSNPQLQLNSVFVEKTGYNATLMGSFVTSDPVLNAIIDLSMEHVTITMSDAFVDTTGREDGQVLSLSLLLFLCCDSY